MKWYLTFIVAIIALITGCSDNVVKVFDAKCGNLETPVGVAEDKLKFSWKLESEKQDNSGLVAEHFK